MRVAVVCPYSLAAPGGVQSHVLALGRALHALGLDAAVVAPTDGAQTEAFGVPVHSLGRTIPLNVNGSVARLAVGPLVAARARHAVRGFDIVHVHEPLQFAVSLTSTLTAPHPLVGTFHAAAESQALYAALKMPLGRLVRRLDAAWAVSDAAADLVERYFATRPPIEPNGVEVARFAGAQPLPERSKVKGPVVLFVGRDEPRKGLDVLREAWGQLRSALPDAQLWIAGPGTESVHDPGTRAWGGVDEATLPRLYASADLYCSPARFGESFGIVLLEAMAAGTPVVASDIPGYAAVSGDGAAARLVPVGDATALAGAIAASLDDAPGLAGLVSAGRRRAAEFDWSVLAARMAGHYEDVVAGPARR